MKKRKIFVWYYSITFFLLITLTSCQKQETEIQKIDDTRYIVDSQMILILCEKPEAGIEYIEAIKRLKGNGDEILAAIQQLEALEQTVAVKNAIGVGKNLLRETDEAETYFEEALLESTDFTEKAIVLSNLAEAKYYQQQYEKKYDIALSVINEAVEEYQKVNTDRVLSMVLESNQISLAMMNDYPQPMVKHIARLKKLLKEERKQFGSNQFIGMLNFQSIGIACHYDGQSMKRSLAYMEKSWNINHELYQYTFYDIHSSNIIATMYNNEPDSLEKKLEYQNKCIELQDKWQSKWHYDRLQAYVKRGESYYSTGELEKSAEDYSVVLEQSRADTDIVALSYYYLGEINLMQTREPEKTLDYYLKAFCIWQRYDRPDGLQTIKTSIYNVYKSYEYINETPDFEVWFAENIEKAQKRMAETKR